MRRAILLPVVFVTYSLAYLDRANYGFGAAAGLAKTLHITDQRAALLGALFFLGYCAFQVPAMLLVRRLSATRVIFFALLLWGTFSALTGVIHNFMWLAVDRFLLGIGECAILPAMLLLLTRWFTRAERSRANAILVLGNPITLLWMSALTGILIQKYGWQRAFIAEGLPAVVWAFVWIAVGRDSPSQARWMPADEAAQLEAEIAAQQPVVASAEDEAARLRDVVLNPAVIVLSIHYFFWSLGVYGFVLWLPTIVQRGGQFSMGKTGVISAIPYVIAIGALLLLAALSDRAQRRFNYIWPSLLVSGLAMFGSFAAHGFTLAFVFLIVAGATMYAPYGPFFAFIPEFAPSRLRGETFAIVNSLGALGGFAGSYVVGLLQSLTGGHRAGDLLMSLSLIVAALLLLVLRRMPAAANIPEFRNA